MKIRFIVKKIRRTLKPYFGLPHVWALLIITALSVIACWVSIACKDIYPYLSSIFANIFAGLLTGVTICLISTLKSVSLYRTERLIAWLNDLDNGCLKFIDMLRKISYHKEKDFKNDEEVYNYIYDTLCCGNDICSMICQGQFDETLPFNTYKYCKKELLFDVDEISESNDRLREDIIELDLSLLSDHDIRMIFQEMNKQILTLNGHIISKLGELNAKKKAIHISFG